MGQGASFSSQLKRHTSLIGPYEACSCVTEKRFLQRTLEDLFCACFAFQVYQQTFCGSEQDYEAHKGKAK